MSDCPYMRHSLCLSDRNDPTLMEHIKINSFRHFMLFVQLEKKVNRLTALNSKRPSEREKENERPKKISDALNFLNIIRRTNLNDENQLNGCE